MSKNVKIVKQAAEAMKRRDIKALGALTAPECEIVPIRASVESAVYRGPDAWAKFFAISDEAWEDLTAEAETFRDGGDWVLVFGRIQGRGRTSGADLDVRAAAVFRFRDGLITSLRVYTDRAEALAAVGLAPEVDAPDPLG